MIGLPQRRQVQFGVHQSIDAPSQMIGPQSTIDPLPLDRVLVPRRRGKKSGRSSWVRRGAYVSSPCDSASMHWGTGIGRSCVKQNRPFPRNRQLCGGHFLFLTCPSCSKGGTSPKGWNLCAPLKTAISEIGERHQTASRPSAGWVGHGCKTAFACEDA